MQNWNDLIRTQLDNLASFPAKQTWKLGEWIGECRVRPGVANFAALPMVDNEIGDVRVSTADQAWYIWDGAAWQSMGGGGGGAVNSVTASAPIASSGGANPNISLTGIVPAANGGTGIAAPGAAGNVLTSNGVGGWTSSTPATTSPAAPLTSVQFNNGGAFGGSAGLTWNGSTLAVDGAVDRATAGTLTVGGTTATAITVGQVGVTTTFPGPVNLIGDVTTVGGTQFTTDAQFDGNVTFGNASTDNISFVGQVDTAITQEGIAAPALSPAGTGRIYFDSGTNTFKASQNGGAYVDVINSAAPGGGLGDVQLNDGAGNFTGNTDLTFSGLVLSVTNQVNVTDGLNTLTLTKDAVTTDAATLTLGSPTAAVNISTAFTLPTTDGANGEVLTTDGAGNVSWAAAGGGSPAAPLNSVQFNNAGAFGGSANLTYNSGTSTLGSAAALNLEAAADSTWNVTGANLTLSTTGGGPGRDVTIQSGNEVYINAGGVGDSVIVNSGYNPTNFQVRDQTFGSQPVFFVDGSTGFAGFKTSTPASLLSVGATSQFQVDSSGNIVAIRGQTTSFPAANAAGALTNDGAGNLSWTPAGAGTITGSGTATQLAYFTGASAIGSETAVGSNSLTWDSTNNFFGVRTASPGAVVDIQAGTTSSAAPGLRVQSTSSGAGFNYNNLVSVTSGVIGNSDKAFEVSLTGAPSLTYGAFGIFVTNATTSTVNSYFTNGGGPVGVRGDAVGVNGSGVQTGTSFHGNVGVLGSAAGSVVNVGTAGVAATPENNHSNVGVVGTAANTGSGTAVAVGGLFTVSTATGSPDPSYGDSAALIADNQDTSFPIFLARDNGTTVFTVANDGAVTSKNTANSTTAFQVQNAASTTILDVDTTNQRVGVGTATPNEALTVNGVLSLAEGTAPSATASFGKFYALSSDSRPYFLDDGGQAYNLTLDRFNTLTPAASVAIDTSPALPVFNSIALNQNTTFTTSNLGNGRSASVRVICDGTTRTLTFPGGWTWLGSGPPSSLAANDVGYLSITAYGATDADVVAAWSYENAPAAVTGSGTATRVAFWNGSSTLSSDANLYWDDTNNRLGVGNGAPAATLDVGDGSGASTHTSRVFAGTAITQSRSTSTTSEAILNATNSTTNGVQLSMLGSANATVGGPRVAGEAYLGTNAGVLNIGSLRATTPSIGFFTGTVTEVTEVERARIANTEFVVNDPGNAYNFRVESDGNANMLFVDGTNDRVAVGTSATTHTFNIGSGASSNFAVASGGRIHTYDGSAPTNGQVLIGDTALGNFAKATITAGTGISVTNGAGSITIAATGAAASSSTDITGYVAQEALNAGDLVRFVNDAGTPKVQKADATNTDARLNPVGFAVAAALAGAAVTVRVAGVADVPAARFDAAPAVTNVGQRVFVSTTSGQITLTAPSASGDILQRVGVLVDGSGSPKVLVQIGDPTLL